MKNRLKVLWLTNIPSPYRVDFFNEFGKYCDLTADYLIIRHNRVLLVEFCYDLTSNKDDDMKESKVVFKMNKLESTLKKYLPVDTVVKTHLFFIRKGNNNFEIDRLARAIDEFYLRTTNKDLIKLIK